MDLPRLQALKEYWFENPPLHLMVKAYLGYGEKASTPSSVPTVLTPPTQSDEAAIQAATQVMASTPERLNQQALNSTQLHEKFAAAAKRMADQGASNV